MDKTQFSKVVCHNYGYDEALGEEYLDKFVDFNISLSRGSNFSNYEEVRDVIEDYLKKIGFLNEKHSQGIVGLIAALYLYKNKNFRQLRKILNQISLYKLETDIKNEFLSYILFDIDNFKKSSIIEIKEDLIKLVEYCLECEIIAWESGIPDDILIPDKEQIKISLFKSNIQSELLELFLKYLDERDKKYFKFPDEISELGLNPQNINDDFLGGWRSYLNI